MKVMLLKLELISGYCLQERWLLRNSTFISCTFVRSQFSHITEKLHS